MCSQRTRAHPCRTQAGWSRRTEVAPANTQSPVTNESLRAPSAQRRPCVSLASRMYGAHYCAWKADACL